MACHIDKNHIYSISRNAMRNLTVKIFLILSCFMGISFGSPFVADAATAPKRNYNCRMPHRDNNVSGRKYSSHHLFGDLGLSHRQIDRLDKSYSKYCRDIDKYMRQASSDPRRAEYYHRNALKRENSFLNEVRRNLNPSQYRIFEKRFKSLVPRHQPNSAPRPGSGIGPMMPGPAPTVMTR